MDAIYQTKLYKSILSYSMHTIKYCKYNTFVKVLAFTVDEYNGLNTKYCIYVKLSFDEINKTIFIEYIISEYASEEEASIIDKLRIDYIFINKIYNDLFKDIKDSNYVIDSIG